MCQKNKLCHGENYTTKNKLFIQSNCVRFIEKRGDMYDFTLSKSLFHKIFECLEGSIPFTCSTSPSFILNGLSLRWSFDASDTHNGFNFETSVHPSIINGSKGIATDLI